MWSPASASTTFHICTMSAVFADVAELRRHGLAELGYAHVSPAALAAGCPNIILGAHLVEDPAQLPGDSIIILNL